MGPLGDFPDKDGTMKFNSPTLFLRGLQSHYIPDSAFPLISSLFPKSKIVDIDCGHWIVQDRPEEFKKGSPLRLLASIFYAHF
jgi:pimeloyl-ACP methyl ester carboxylesterase